MPLLQQAVRQSIRVTTTLYHRTHGFGHFELQAEYICLQEQEYLDILCEPIESRAIYATPGQLHSTVHDLPFRLTPECRKCYKLFGSDAALREHLRSRPKHKIPFEVKKYNLISKFAKQNGPRVCCLYCAKGYDSEAKLQEHCEKARHVRTKEQGMIPRFAKDNHWYKSVDVREEDEHSEDATDPHMEELAMNVLSTGP